MNHSRLLLTVAIILGVVLLFLTYFPKKAYINKQNELVLKPVLGTARVIPLSETTACEMSDTLLSHLIRTNGLSLGRYQTGYFRNRHTKQKLYLFLCGKGEKKCFVYDGYIYVVDNITTEEE